MVQCQHLQQTLCLSPSSVMRANIVARAIRATRKALTRGRSPGVLTVRLQVVTGRRAVIGLKHIHPAQPHAPALDEEIGPGVGECLLHPFHLALQCAGYFTLQRSGDSGETAGPGAISRHRSASLPGSTAPSRRDRFGIHKYRPDTERTRTNPGLPVAGEKNGSLCSARRIAGCPPFKLIGVQ